MTPEFKAWPKIPRLNRDITITEKIDGTNACVIVPEDPDHNPLAAQSRKRVITPADDNYGFAQWVADNASDLGQLGSGHHFGEWYGRGIQRGYGLDERRFALFNVDKWGDPEARPDCCDVVPVIERTTAKFLNSAVNTALDDLEYAGSWAVPGFPTPEGVVIYHHAANQCFKVLLEGDEIPKGVAA